MSFPADKVYQTYFARKRELEWFLLSLGCFIGLAVLNITLFSVFELFKREETPPSGSRELLLTLNFAGQDAAAATNAPPPAMPPAVREQFDPPEQAPPFQAPPETAPVEAAPAAGSEALPAAATAAAASSFEAGGIAAESGDGPAGNRAMSEAEYLALIVALLEKNKIYPLSVRKRGIEGDIKAEFTIRRDGSVYGLRQADNSGHRFLAQAAFETIRSAAPFPVMEGRGGDYTVQVNIRYQLEDSGGS
ncbi:MAG: energy transducer TonB [Spirochaetaceae bacterium]|nr:energy transducer TonB [Spirochaetaceae bacterium]